MRRIFGPRSEEIVEGCRKLCNEKHGFYFLQNIVKMTEYRKIRWTRHVACIEDSTNENIIFVGETVGNKSHLYDGGTDRKYMMKTITSNSMVGGSGLDFSSSGASGGLF